MASKKTKKKALKVQKKTIDSVLWRDFVLEIGCEEIPARFVSDLLNSLSSMISLELTRLNLSFGEVVTFGTYRRLTVFVSQIQTMQADSESFILGPPLSVAKLDSGEYGPAAFGFCKKNDCQLDDLETALDAQGRPCISIKKHVKGQSSLILLSESLPKILSSIPLPISMRWADQPQSFIRPIHWILALLGTVCVPFSFAGISSSTVTYGHRFLSGDPLGSINGASLILSDVSQYHSLLKENFVQVDPFVRKQIIETILNEEGQGGAILSDLVDELVYLSEWPMALVSSFREDFLKLPSEVLVESMVKNQKYHPIYQNGVLTSRFVVIADNVTPQNQGVISSGATRVLEARLSDAQFFYHQDLEVDLSSYVDSLKSVVYQKGLGSLFDRKERLKAIALLLDQRLSLSLNSDHLIQIGDLCKADLVTQMVYEFPKLQGVMGSIYSCIQEYDPLVSEAILEHYKPLSSQSALPNGLYGALFSIADRLDTIVACFQNGLIPSGSQDPHGVRRAVFGILAVLHAFSFSISLTELLNLGYDVLGKGRDHFELCLAFCLQRVVPFLTDSGLSLDIATGVLPLASRSLLNALSVGKELQFFRLEFPDRFKSCVELAIRVKRLALKCESPLELSLLSFESELEDTLALQVQGYLKDTFDLTALESFLEPMNRYFESTLVMVEDIYVRQTRLSFLYALHNLFLRLGDFEAYTV